MKQANYRFFCVLAGAILGMGALMAPAIGLADEPVPQGQMEEYCQSVASELLGTRTTNLSTEPVGRRGSDFVVLGQSPKSGNNFTTFECVFGKRGMFKGVTVTGRRQNNGSGSRSMP